MMNFATPGRENRSYQAQTFACFMYRLQSDLHYPRFLRPKLRPLLSTPLLSADLGSGYPRFLRPKFSTPKYRG